MMRKKPSSTPSSTTSDLSDDPDTEEALKGFDFLASPDELDSSPESKSGEDSGDWGESGVRGGWEWWEEGEASPVPLAPRAVYLLLLSNMCGDKVQ